MMPETGERAPARMLVAVRAMAPVAGMPPKSGETMLAMPWAHEFDVGVVAVAGHAVGNDGGEHAFKRGEHGDGKGRGDEGQMCSAWKSGMAKGGKPRGMPPNRLPMVSTGR